ncbi:MAG: hypothetical protein O6826_02770, partial [Acidobacteria bacterium]|nr:hypothetical protein [Acidobacteriota bacterium]
GFVNWQFAAFKRTKITESQSLEFRAEFFNLFNRVNLFLPEVDVDSSFFGQSTSAFDPRQIQFALKLLF